MLNRAEMESSVPRADAGYAVAACDSFNCGTVQYVFGVSYGTLRDIGVLDGTQAQDLTVSERAGSQGAVDFVRMAHHVLGVGTWQTRLREMGVHL